ncbi:hypothetical protein [Novosphingobium sp. UBA1939]|uniref:hypothetical protein n=1 Tax=Novosphingobium sp. UBA1939 TaxID=1946982 RepID=UPI0025FA8640|nr:hypothetical protein [Novosphingobium sp. UBA1939]
MTEIEIARSELRNKADTIRKTFYDRHHMDIGRWSLEQGDQRFLHLVTKGKLADRALLSNMFVRKWAAYAWIDALLADFEQYPDRERVWITMAWDAPITWERKPEIDTVACRNMASQHLRRSRVEGTGVLEFDTWKNIAGERGKRVTPHIHFLGHARQGETIDAETLQESMRSRSALSNSIGAPSVVVKEVGKTPKDLATLGCYMSKLPAYAKNPVPSRVWNGYDLVQVNHAPGSVTRLIEMLSFMELGDVMFSIGEGKHIAAQVRDQVRMKCACQRGAISAPIHSEIERRWRSIRQTNGNKTFGDCTIVTRAHQRR